MSKPAFEISRRRASVSNSERSPGNSRTSPLAELVKAYLKAKQMRQVDFCRETGFDQGLLSKILSSVVNTLNVESALKLAEGMNIPPSVIFEAIGKQHVEEMLRRFYCDSDKLM
jgi:transcriptional regulator with XRE-family HTH domain